MSEKIPEMEEIPTIRMAAISDGENREGGGDNI